MPISISLSTESLLSFECVVVFATMEETEPGELIENVDMYMIALDAKRLVDEGEITQSQANTLLKSTGYRLDEKPIYEISEIE